MPSISSSGSGGVVDISLAALLAPTTSSRNVVQGTGAGVTPLNPRGFAGQTADIFVADNSSGTDLVTVAASGVLGALKGMGYAYREVSANTTLTANDHVVIANSAAAAGTWNASITADAPVGWYKLDDSTTTATDSGSGAHNGTYSGTYTQTQTPLLTGSTNAVNFNGGRITVGDFNDFAANAAFTVGCWFKPSTVDATTRHLISKTNGSTDGWMIFYSTSGYTARRLSSGTSDSVTSTTPPTVGTTVFLAATYDGTTLKLYVNGTQEDSKSSTRSLPGNTNNLVIARSSADTSQSLGDMDEVVLFGSDLGATEISSLNALGAGGGGAGPITLTLPAASSRAGFPLLIWKGDATSGSVTVNRAGSDTINGATSKVLSSQYSGLMLMSLGDTRWFAASLG